MLNKQNGFTLIEIIIVIVALVVISAIGLPKVTGSIDSSRKSTDIANAKLIYNATKQIIDNNNFPIHEDILLKITEEELNNKDTYADIKQNILVALEQEIPVPKYKSSTIGKASYFLLKIDQKGNIMVLTGSDDPEFTQIQVAPEPDMAFN